MIDDCVLFMICSVFGIWNIKNIDNSINSIHVSKPTDCEKTNIFDNYPGY